MEIEMDARTLTVPTARRADETLETVAPMRIAVAYHDTASLVKAIQFCDRIVQQHWEEIEIECTWWKFSFLRHPQIFRESVEAAAHADLIVLSLPAEQGLPDVGQEWIEEWLDQRHFRPGALVSLIPQDPTRPGGTAAIENYLQTVAQRGVMDFFAHHLTTLGPGKGDLDELELNSSLLDSLPDDTSMPRWGINE